MTHEAYNRYHASLALCIKIGGWFSINLRLGAGQIRNSSCDHLSCAQPLLDTYSPKNGGEPADGVEKKGADKLPEAEHACTFSACGAGDLRLGVQRLTVRVARMGI